tara:strand:+ start:390 stop:623 length:234 start_codon:yes stop_codon:yes gene_type:complete
MIDSVYINYSGDNIHYLNLKKIMNAVYKKYGEEGEFTLKDIQELVKDRTKEEIYDDVVCLLKAGEIYERKKGVLKIL